MHVRFLCLAALIAGISLASGGQAAAQSAPRDGEALAMIIENPDRAASNMHSYEFGPLVDTRAPKGFKPFYVSHYGRHGSRYETSASFAKAALDGLRKADSLSLLTPAGAALYRDVQAVSDEHKGMDGALTPRGGREHQMLAERMVGRYPSVFNRKDRNEVLACSSTSQRCIVSMANFLGALNGAAPQLDFTCSSGERLMAYINPPIDYARCSMDFLKQAGSTGQDWSPFLSRIFSDPASAGGLIGDTDAFINSIYSAGCVCQDLDFLGIDIFRNYFTPEELTGLWKTRNDMIYGLWGNSVENGDVVSESPVPLLLDFVGKADEAIAAGSRRCADLRFGHDTTILPLAALLGIDDPQGRRFPISEAHEYWFSNEQVQMATNIQMVFYRNRKDEVLAKVLFNEREVSIPALKPLEGPYYPWDTLRAWFLSLCQ